MPKLMSISLMLLMLAVVSFVNGQGYDPPELKALRENYVQETKEYKNSLTRLRDIYRRNVEAAENKLVTSKRLLADGQAISEQVTENERALASAKEKLAETDKQITKADEEIKAVLDESKAAELQKECTKAQSARRRKGSKPCDNWTLVASRKQGKRSVELNYKLVCR